MRNIIKIFVNILTTSRLVLSILLMMCFKNISKMNFLIYILLLFLTDFIDGKLARGFKVQTIYGSNMDAIADKFLSIGMLLLLLKNNSIVWVPFIGEIIISIINIKGKIEGKRTESSNIGKIKTWFIAITVFICFGNYFNLITRPIVWISCIVTFIIQIKTAIDYIKYLEKQKPVHKKKKEKNATNILYRLFSTEYYLKNN